MTLQGGDREFGHGDQVTVVYDGGSAAAAGTPVKVTGRAPTEDHVTVEPVAADDPSDGVLADAADTGEPIQMVSHGLVWGLTDGAGALAGEFVDEGAGAFTQAADGDYRVYEAERTDKDGNPVALIRYEN